VLVQEKKLAHTSFPLGCSDVVQDVFALELMKEGKLAFANGGMMVSEMSSCFPIMES
jgi:hypothetical protein